MKNTYIFLVLIVATLLSLQTMHGENVTGPSTEKATQCEDFKCDLTCEKGFKKDSSNCSLCQCLTNGDHKTQISAGDEVRPPPEQMTPPTAQTTPPTAQIAPVPEACPLPMCRTYCEQGYKKDDNGCMTCDCIDVAEWETGDFEANHAHQLQVIDASFMFINLTWVPPNVTPDKINNYKVYYFNLTTETKPVCPDGVKDARIRLVPPTQTIQLVKGLKSGTRYGFCVQTNYSDGHVTTSHLVSYTTLGVGPSNPCNCTKTKYINYEYPCDLATGECRCKTKYQTGPLCDRCLGGYYMHSKMGCQECHCHADKATGNCSSIKHPDGAEMFVCDCTDNFSGQDCSICAAGYFLNQTAKQCVPCHCNNNTRPGATNICNHLTGECLECGYNTEGPHCERCKEGYLGEPLNKTCAAPQPSSTAAVPARLTHSPTAFHEISIIVLSCVSLAVVLVIITVVIIYCARRARGKPFQFWSVQMRGSGRDDISFSPMSRNSDVCLLNDDGVQYFERDESPSGGRLEFLGGSQIFKSPRS